MNPIARDILMHYGMPRRSGRYPWGSGENPYQRTKDFLARVEDLEKDGKTEKEIAQELGISTTSLRTQKSLARAERRADLVATAKGLRDKGYNTTQIAKEMGYDNESSVRSLLNEKSESRMNAAKTTASYLKEIVDNKGMVDVGVPVNLELGVSPQKMRVALEILKNEGYKVYDRRMPQVTNPGKRTTMKVLCPPGTEYKEVFEDISKINSVKDYDRILTDDGTKIRPAFQYPASMDSKRIQVVYAEDGGTQKDGVVEIRRGVDDLSLGESHYAQVRILVDGTHYIKGMAIYSDDLPEGIDVRFNTNKKRGTPLIGEEKSVLKPITKDPSNPFGSLIKEKGGQSYYTDANGEEKLSLINKRAEEGDWGEWSNKLSAQFLSKQNKTLISKQLDLAKADKRDEYDEIVSLTNPVLKKKLLLDFAESCDYTAVHLNAAALPRQRYQVILPLTTIKDNEVFAPNYNNGEKVALIRYPHGGTFEIPILTVNNKQPEGIRVITKNAKDAIGINTNVAARLSGADFDGDTVMVIPTGKNVKITSTPSLAGLRDFDPKIQYGPDSTSVPYKRMTKDNTQRQMGIVSNLITDMTILGATDEELERAVKHSMVVIDAEKHNLDYKRSEKENNIAALKKKYQIRVEDGELKVGGSSTLISRAKSPKRIPKRQGNPKISKDGSLIWKTSNDAYYEKDGVVKVRTQTSTQMAEAKNAYDLVSEARSPKELIYADYANYMKALANTARKEAMSTKGTVYNPSAAKLYAEEVASLTSKVRNSARNAPRERQAQRLANSIVEAKRQSDGELNKKELGKISQQALSAARERVGAKRPEFTITDREWEAIQSGAVTKSMFEEILKYTDNDKLKERATPRSNNSALSSSKISRIKALKSSGYTNEEIAKAVGISASTVTKYL